MRETRSSRPDLYAASRERLIVANALPSKHRGRLKLGGSGAIRCYGLFWRAEEVWYPNRRGRFQLLGRLGANQVCDFRDQRGVYVLYDEYGPYYVGLTRAAPLGNRLNQHRQDRHRGKWDRFRWFGFAPVLDMAYDDGTLALGPLEKRQLAEATASIGEAEALLIQALGTHMRGNAVQMRFPGAEHWQQVMAHEVEEALATLS
jgi:hypothetical protein